MSKTLDDIRKRGDGVWLCAENCPSHECQAEHDRHRLLGALDAVLALANVAETHGLHGAGFRMIPSDQLRAAVTDALEANK